MNICKIKDVTIRRSRYFYRKYIVIILLTAILIFFLINLIISFLLPEKITTSDIKLESDSISSYRRNHSIRHIYIDVGCFNGETIEYFLHFIPNSSFYDIFTFEPDPDNYQLCKQRLAETKFMNMNITILQKVAWIRDEKVYFRTKRGRESRIDFTRTADDSNSTQIDAIDFSSWLARLAKPNNTKIHIKLSMYGAEVPVLIKMIKDDTLGLADMYEIEWTDRENPYNRPPRIYIQLMLDSYGFDTRYFLRLEDLRAVFQKNGTISNVSKYYDWRQISLSDTYAHYVQRPDVFVPIRILNKGKRKINKT